MNFLFCKKNLEIFLIYKIFCLDRPHFRKSVVRNLDTVCGVIFEGIPQVAEPKRRTGFLGRGQDPSTQMGSGKYHDDLQNGRFHVRHLDRSFCGDASRKRQADGNPRSGANVAQQATA